MSAPGHSTDRHGGSPSARTARRSAEPDWQSHPSVNIPDPCPYCGAAALHAQHCKRMCLACGWVRSCVD
ncbi:MAG: hypothetical protein PVJ49_20345 [Acidobacteriota bacterium]